MPLMRPGVVGIIDALGFKGIWDRVADPNQIVESLRKAKQRGLSPSHPGVAPSIPRLWELSALMFSDTIVVTAVLSATAAETEDPRAHAVPLVAGVLSSIMADAATGEVPLVFRGVVTVGDCFIDAREQILLGRPVDEASELMNSADGAFVWFAPTALAAERPPAFSPPFYRQGSTMMPAYAVPLKGGGNIDTSVVNPFFYARSDDQRIEIFEGYRNAMSIPALDVVLKWQNTERFLRYLWNLGHGASPSRRGG